MLALNMTLSIPQSLADLLVQVFSVRQLEARELQQHQETDTLAGRVREIAMTALNLSERELQEFFAEEGSADHAVRHHNSDCG